MSARWWHDLYQPEPVQIEIASATRGRPIPLHSVLIDIDALLAAHVRACEVAAVGPWPFSAAPTPRVLCRRVADEAHASRERARRNGRGRSRAARRRLAAHVARCPWCPS